MTPTVAWGARITGGVAVGVQKASMSSPDGVGGKFLVSRSAVLPLGPGEKGEEEWASE